MSTNEIIPFSSDVTANVLTQAAYVADSQRLIGNQPGTARSSLVNKAMRQASIMVAGLAQFMADRQANNITDLLSPVQVENYLQDALHQRSASLPASISGATTSWYRKSSDGYIEQGIAGVHIASLGGFTDVTFPIPFLTTVLDIQVSVLSAADQMVGWGFVSLTGCRVETGVADSAARVVNIMVRGY